MKWLFGAGAVLGFILTAILGHVEGGEWTFITFMLSVFVGGVFIGAAFADPDDW